MDNNKISREKLIKKIRETIPSNLKPVEYLMEVLGISKVSVYRRINCEVPFTYDEMVKLSQKLGFSMEEIIYSNSTDKAVFMFQDKKCSSYQELFLCILKGYNEDILKESKSSYRKAIMAFNHLWLIHIMGMDNAFKFFYYRWLFQLSSNSLGYLMEDVTIPSEAFELRDKIVNGIQLLNNTTLIVDKLFFFNTIKDIQYYYRRKFINREELLLIKDDLDIILKQIEIRTTTGTYAGITHYFYLSYLSIFTNSIYVEYDDKFISYFYEYSIRPLRTRDTKVCYSHKKWMESLKKHSVLISGSNEALQMEFFKKQNKYLENLINDIELVP